MTAAAMIGIGTLSIITAALVLLGLAEYVAHRRRLLSIPIRIHVNGTRGKSSVTRLIAAGLRAGGITTCAKTTGTLARMILPNGREVPIFRPAGPNIIEQKRIVAVANSYGAKALVIECMAVQPHLQSLCEFKLIRASCGVVTNARPDHLDIMGPEDRDVARALAGMTPVNGTLYTSEREQLPILEQAARDRSSKLVTVSGQELGDELDEALAGFSYTEHPDNVAIALRVCADLGVEREIALPAMQQAQPDPGVMTDRSIDFFGRKIVFVNGFAANDPVSTEWLWALSCERHADVLKRIAVFNCRADRPERSLQLGAGLARWSPADHVVLMGTGTYLLARAATKAGLDEAKLVFAEGLGIEQVFEKIIALVGESALVMGMGNAASLGLDLAAYFNNRAAPETRS